MPHPSRAASTAESLYQRGYRLGRGVAADWSGACLRRAIATRIQAGRVATEAEWGIIDGLTDILIARGGAPGWSKLQGCTAAPAELLIDRPRRAWFGAARQRPSSAPRGGLWLAWLGSLFSAGRKPPHG